MANGDVLVAPQAKVWAYHDVTPQRWDRHSDLMLSLTIVGDQRSYTVLINIPPDHMRFTAELAADCRPGTCP